MKKSILIITLLLIFIVAARAQHPLDVNISFIPHIDPDKTQFSAEYLAFPRISFETGIGFGRNAWTSNRIIKNTGNIESTHFFSRRQNYFIQTRFYPNKEKVGVGEGINLGLLFDFAHYTTYERNGQDAFPPFDERFGLALVVGYKRVIWDKLVVGMDTQFVSTLERYRADFAYFYDFDLLFLGKIGYRF